jgi:hypothetical protein
MDIWIRDSRMFRIGCWDGYMCVCVCMYVWSIGYRV